VAAGNGDDPPKTSTKPLLVSAKEAAFGETAKLAGLTAAGFGRSSTAVSVTHAGEPDASKTLKLVPITPENALRSR